MLRCSRQRLRLPAFAILENSCPPHPSILQARSCLIVRNMLLETDPDRFFEIVVNDNADERYASFASLDDLLLCEIVRYGTSNRPDMIGPLGRLYRSLTSKLS